MLRNALFPFADFLWILQKDEYESRRYFYWLKRFFFRRNFVVSEKLVYTLRARITLSAVVLLWAGSLSATVVSAQPPLSLTLTLLVLWCLFIPLFVGLINLLLTPFFLLGHRYVRMRAARVVREHGRMLVIAVVGSYGKTTTKHFLYDLLRFNYRAQMVPGTTNTTSGIAAWLSRKLASDTEVLIVEMDAYHPGEIARSAAISPPDFVIITSIGEQHMQRFGDDAALAAALGEAVTFSKKDAVIVGDKETLDYMRSLQDGRTFAEVDTSRLVYAREELHANELSQSNRENLSRALEVASRLSISRAFVEDTVSHLELPERRQKETSVYGYEGIDDSYNISSSTARAGLAAARALADSRKKKLLVIAAGIPELGREEKDGNRKLGLAIAASADHAVILDTVFAPDIIRGLGTFPHTLYKRLPDFLADTSRFPKEEWVVLLEPTLPDLYY